MKLLLKLSGLDYDHTLIVEWEKELLLFPSFVTYDNRLWEWILYDDDTTRQADKMLTFSEHKRANWPVDFSGKPLEASSLERMFDLKDRQNKFNKCECGSEKLGSDKHSSWCAKWSKT
jgi:hypothetical protein